jgi:hypothetical protein
LPKEKIFAKTKNTPGNSTTERKIDRCTKYFDRLEAFFFIEKVNIGYERYFFVKK